MDMTQQRTLEHMPGATRANRWALWGIGAGVLGIVATMVTDPIIALTDAQKRQGAAVLGLRAPGGLPHRCRGRFPRRGLCAGVRRRVAAME